MLAPDSALNEHYRITYLVDDRPDCRIYRAIDQRDSLRVLIAELPQPSEGALQDAQLLAGQIAGVTAPGLLTLRDHFARDLTYYLVAEDAGGQDLERVARDRGGPLPEPEVLTTVDRLLGAVEALHGRSPALYLGDLRATDLWSSPDGGLFLAPFALVRHIGADVTPYRAPELNDASAEPTSASDVYAIGAVLYQLLTGWAPPPAPQREAGTPLNSPRMLNARVSVLAEQLALRALERKPANRYQRAGEMRSALETVRLMAGRPLGATPPSLSEQMRTVSQPGAAPPPPVPVPPPGASAPPPAAPAGVYGPPPAAPPPTGYPQPAAAPPGYPAPSYPGQPQYAGYGPPASAPAAPARQGPRLSTGCLIGIVIALGLVALLICAVGGYVGWLVLSGAGVPGLPNVAALPGAAAATAPATAPTGQPTAAAPALSGTVSFTETRRLQEDAVGAALYSPAGDTLAVGLGGNIQLRSGEELEPGATLSGHTGDISALAFSPDGALLASGAQDDNTVRVWDVASGRLLRELSGHEGWIRSLAFSPDGRTLASGSTDLTIRLWDAQSGAEQGVLAGHTGWLGNIAFSPDGATLASAGRDGTVRLWDVQARSARGEPIYTAPADPNNDDAPFWLTGLSYSPDGERLATGSVSGSIYVIDAESGRLQRELTGHQNWVTIRGVSFSPDGRTIASASLDGSVRLWLPGSGVQTAELRRGGLRVLGLSWHPDGSRLVSTSDSAGSLTVWDVEAERPTRTLQLAQGAVTALAYTPSGDVLGTGGAGGTVRLHVLADDRQITLSGGAPTSQYIGFISDTRIAAVSEAGEVVLIDLASQGENQQLEGLEGFALNLVVSEDRRLIAAGNERGDVTIWDAASLEALHTLGGLGGAVYTVAFSPDATLIAAATNEPADRPTIQLWDVASGERRATIEGHGAPITSLELPAGQAVVMSSSGDGTLKVWDLASGDELRSIAAPAEEGWFTSFAVSPDGALLATGTYTGGVAFWDARSGEALSQFALEGGTVLEMAFRGDGTQLAVSTRDGTVYLLEPAG